MKKQIIMKTFDIQFQDESNSDCKGFILSYNEAYNYIEQYNGTNESYFADYKGGMVQIIDNETEEVLFETEIF